MFNFLKLGQNAFGLNISDSSCKVARLKKSGKHFQLVSWARIDIKPGVVENGEIKKEDELSNTLKEAIKNIKGEKIKSRDVIVSLPEKRGFLEIIKFPKMEQKELKSAVMFQAESYIPMPINEVRLDFQIIESVSGGGNNINVLLAAFPEEIINQYISALKLAGLRPIVFETESQAITRAIINKDNADHSFFVVNLEENDTLFTAYSGRSLCFSSSISISLKALTQTVLDELSLQIKKYVNYYKTYVNYEPDSKRKKTQMDKEKIILCGKIAGAKGIAKTLSSSLQMQVDVADMSKNIFLGAVKKKSLMQPNELLEYAIALGLAMRNFEKENL